MGDLMQQHQQEGDRVQENENETQREREALTPERFFSFDKTNDINTNKHQCQKKKKNPPKEIARTRQHQNKETATNSYGGAFFFQNKKTGKRH